MKREAQEEAQDLVEKGKATSVHDSDEPSKWKAQVTTYLRQGLATCFFLHALWLLSDFPEKRLKLS